MKPLRVGFLGYDGVTALDLVGPMDAFTMVTAYQGFAPGTYELIIVGLSAKPFICRSGMAIHPQETLETVKDLDTLIIAGGPGSRSPEIGNTVKPWLLANSPRIRRVASVCTGIYLLALTGLLDGRRVTTHWQYLPEVARQFPKLIVDQDALFLKSDRLFSSAGITAGIDLSLALIEEDCGSEMALKVARGMVVYLKRPGGQRQFSDPLRVQAGANEQFAGLVTWMASHLGEDLSVDTLAARSNLSPRHFSRLFKECFGDTPAAIVKSLRLDQARNLLSGSNASIASVAKAVGFSGVDAFRRAFVRQFGVAPSGYRAPFRPA